jgi:type IV secretory pathway TrbD component
VSFHTVFGYLTGLYFIKPDLDATILLRTTAVVHLLDAILCALIAGHSARSKKIWVPAGFIFGIWALAILFVLPAKKNNNIARPLGC